MQSLHRILIGIDIDIAKFAEGAQIVKSAYMVIMYMCQKNTINLTKGLTQYLLPEVRTTVDKHARSRCFE